MLGPCSSGLSDWNTRHVTFYVIDCLTIRQDVLIGQVPAKFVLRNAMRPTGRAGASNRLILVVLGSLAAFAPFTIDTYLPAFPAISASLHIPAPSVQVTLAATTAGFAVGQMLAGPISDRIGRRVPLLAGCVIHLLASFAVVLSTDLAQLTLARAIQGFGGASAAVIALAVARDLFTGHALTRGLAFIALVSGMAPLVAPVVGSQLLRFGNWRVVFVFLGVYAVIVFIVALAVMPETLPRGAEPKHRPQSERYRVLLGSPAFLKVMLLGATRYTALFAFLQVSPFLFERELGLSPQTFGVVFAASTVGMLVGVQLSARLVRRVSSQRLLALSLSLIALSGGAFAASAFLKWTAIPVLACAILFMLGCGLGLPMIQTLGLMNHPNEAGTAAALIGAASFGAPALLSPVFAGLARAVPSGGLELAIVFGVTSAVGAGIVLSVSSSQCEQP